jgi:hypothetical protein
MRAASMRCLEKTIWGERGEGGGTEGGEGEEKGGRQKKIDRKGERKEVSEKMICSNGVK